MAELVDGTVIKIVPGYYNPNVPVESIMNMVEGAIDNFPSVSRLVSTMKKQGHVCVWKHDDASNYVREYPRSLYIYTTKG